MADDPPRVWNKSRPPYPASAVYVGRGSPWGNPYKLGRDGNRAEVIAKYRGDMDRSPVFRRRVQAALKGRHLLCFCAPLPCHADILLEIANA